MLHWLIDGVVEAVALIVQIHLEQNRLDLAIKEVTAARRWAQDSLLVNLAESWVGLRVVSTSTRCLGIVLILFRAVRNTNKLSTSSKSSHRHLQHHLHKVLSRKRLLRSILVV